MSAEEHNRRLRLIVTFQAGVITLLTVWGFVAGFVLWRGGF